jgi:hypothetical protein
MNELDTIKLPIVMKNGLVHWVSETTHEKIQMALQIQSSHSFMKITELGITINTAEIAGIYTIKQYEEITNIKQGMWQCELKKWHGRKEVCECKKIKAQQDEENRRKAIEEAENKDLTPEEKKRVQMKMVELKQEISRLGIKKSC